MGIDKEIKWLMEDELSENIMKEFVALRSKMCSYLMMIFVMIRRQKTQINAS